MAGFQNYGLNIFHWNCNGLLAHRNELKPHLSQNVCDVICLQETCLKPSKTSLYLVNSVVRVAGSSKCLSVKNAENEVIPRRKAPPPLDSSEGTPWGEIVH